MSQASRSTRDAGHRQRARRGPVLCRGPRRDRPVVQVRVVDSPGRGGHAMSEPVDPFTGEGWDVYAQSVRDDLIPKIDESAIVASFVPDDLVGDVKYAVELGYSIMLDKPLILVVGNQQTADRLSPKLRRVADRIIVADLTTTDGQQTITAALQDVLDDDGALQLTPDALELQWHVGVAATCQRIARFD